MESSHFRNSPKVPRVVESTWWGLLGGICAEDSARWVLSGGFLVVGLVFAGEMHSFLTLVIILIL